MKATPDSPASVASVMAVYRKVIVGHALAKDLLVEVERLAAQSAPTDNSNGETRLWLWKNFVDGRPEYWAFDNPYPINLDNGDPQTLGEPCGYAIFKPSRGGRPDFSEDEVLLRIAQAKSKASYNLEPNNAEADAFDFLRFAKKNLDMHAARVPFAYNGLVTAAVAWIQSAEKILAAQSPAQAPVQPQAVVPAPQTNQQGHQRAFLGLDRAAERAPVVQAGEYPPLPVAIANPNRAFYDAKQMHAYVDADRAAAQVEPVRMLTKEALTDLIAQHLSGTYHCLRVWEAWHVGTMSADDFQDVGESDTPAELADAIIAAGKRIPADGEVRG